MRVLQLTKFYPPFRGGIETVTYELAAGLNKRNITADVLCSNTHLKTVHETGDSGERIIRAASFGKVLSTSISEALVRELIKVGDDYDIIHAQLPDPMACLALWVARPSSKLILQWHSDVVNQKNALKAFLPLQRWILNKAHLVTTSSDAYAQSSPWLQPYLHKVETAPLGIRDPVPAPGDAVAAWRSRYPGRTLIFSLGRMTYYKGFNVLINAAEQLPDDAMVLVGGSGELLDNYRAEVEERGLGGKIAFLGPLNDTDVRALFQACDIFCLPSIVRAEAFGVVLLEAMTASRPIVATDISGSGVPWVNADGVSGFNVPVNDPTALANALQRLILDPDLRSSLGKGARARYLAHFTADSMVERTIELYRSVLEAQ